MAIINASRGFEITGDLSFPVAVCVETHAGWGKAWLAQLDPALDEQELRRFGCHRTFLQIDNKRLSRAGNGELTYFLREPGTYEVSSVYRSYTMHRVVFRVDAAGAVERVATNQTEQLRDVYPRLFDAHA